MASSKNSPGPHDRAPGVPRQRCIKLRTATGGRCTRWATSGSAKLCRQHLEEAKPVKPETIVQTQVSKGVKADARRLEVGLMPRRPAGMAPSNFVLNMQAREALERLGKPVGAHDDPKQVLLEVVRSSWQQVQVWESMLRSVDPSDWGFVGTPPIMGVPKSARGARIEAIQRYLGECTKTAARASSLAINAGLEERLVRLAEEQSILIADTVRAGIVAGIGALHLSSEAELAAINLAVGGAAGHLRALAAGPADDRVPGSNEIYDGIAVEVERSRRAKVVSK